MCVRAHTCANRNRITTIIRNVATVVLQSHRPDKGLSIIHTCVAATGLRAIVHLIPIDIGITGMRQEDRIHGKSTTQNSILRDLSEMHHHRYAHTYIDSSRTVTEMCRRAHVTIHQQPQAQDCLQEGQTLSQSCYGNPGDVIAHLGRASNMH